MANALRLDILPPAQQRVWAELGDIPPSFTLYGGTAIALQLGHRQSIDFDFFANEAFDPRALIADLRLLRDTRITQIEPNTLGVVIDRDGPVQLSFFGLPWLGRIAAPIVADDIELKIASLIDLAGTKASVVQARAEAKDYVDIDALLTHGIDLAHIVAAGAALYGDAFNPQATLKALTYFDDGNLRGLDAEVRRRLVAAVRDTDLDRLPSISAVASAKRP